MSSIFVTALSAASYNIFISSSVLSCSSVLTSVSSSIYFYFSASNDSGLLIVLPRMYTLQGPSVDVILD
nr:MAG TPA: hypothetical protein [Bacteriophage sp.]